jgi:hypothetical protein
MSIGRNAVPCLLLLLALCAGCGPRRKFEDYIPPDATARAALDASLQSWQEGHLPGQVATGPPGIFLVDGHRKTGQELREYEILGPAPGDVPRCYAVRLVLANPRAEEKARFVVLGIDPLWVMRHEDLEMLTHWEHPMDDPKSTAKPTGAR